MTVELHSSTAMTSRLGGEANSREGTLCLIAMNTPPPLPTLLSLRNKQKSGGTTSESKMLGESHDSVIAHIW